MTAAVYSREIHEQYDCSLCAANPRVWDERGRCVGPVAGPHDLGLRIEGEQYPGGSEYPVGFGTCPRGLLRADLRPAAVAVASLVSHAAAAEVDKRWPEQPARLSGLLRVWRGAEAERQQAEHEAFREGLRRKDS